MSEIPSFQLLRFKAEKQFKEYWPRTVPLPDAAQHEIIVEMMALAAFKGWIECQAKTTVIEQAEAYIDKMTDTKSVVGFNPEGMHPGIINGKRVAPKENTAKPYKSGKGKLAKHQERLSNRRNAHSMTVRVAKHAPAYKTPGSMKQHNGGT